MIYIIEVVILCFIGKMAIIFFWYNKSIVSIYYITPLQWGTY